MQALSSFSVYRLEPSTVFRSGSLPHIILSPYLITILYAFPAIEDTNSQLTEWNKVQQDLRNSL